jgi:hypothetical protein
LREEILHQGSVYGVSSAAIPHLVDVAPFLPAASKRDLWIEIGFLVTAGAGRFPSSRAEGLQDGLTAALRAGEALALAHFLADAELAPGDSSSYALACVALAGHRVGRAMWQFPSAGEGYVEVDCPGCGAEHEVDGFGDPLASPCSSPAFAAVPGTVAAWQGVAAAVGQARRDQVLGPGWAGFFDTAWRVAVAGVPGHASSAAVWCLVAAMVAASSGAAAPWARTLARLTGHVRCLECDRVWAIADAMREGAGADPADVTDDVSGPYPGLQGVLFEMAGDPASGRVRGGSIPAATVADGITGFRAAPGRELRAGQAAVRTLWRVDGGAVNALARVAGQPAVVAAAGSDGVRLLDAASGSLARPVLAGPAAAVASLVLPDGGAVIAAVGEEGSLQWWDALAGSPLGGAVITGPAPVLSLAPVRMPARPDPRTAGHLAGLWDGRLMLAASDADGTIQLWDPVARAPLAKLFRRAGQPVTSMTAVDPAGDPPRNGTTLVAVHDGLIVDVWSSAAVHGNRSEMAPQRKLAAAGHRRIAAAAASPAGLGRRKPVLLADRNGTVSTWETFGVRLSDPLLPDPAHREVIGIAVLPAVGGGIAVATASQADRNLRIWEPLRGATTLVPLDVQPHCLLTVGDALLIGHDEGTLALSLTSSLRKDH